MLVVVAEELDAPVELEVDALTPPELLLERAELPPELEAAETLEAVADDEPPVVAAVDAVVAPLDPPGSEGPPAHPSRLVNSAATRRERVTVHPGAVRGYRGRCEKVPCRRRHLSWRSTPRRASSESCRTDSPLPKHASDLLVGDFDFLVSDFDLLVSDFEPRVIDFEARVIDFEALVSDFEARVIDFVPRVIDFVPRVIVFDLLKQAYDLLKPAYDLLKPAYDLLKLAYDLLKHVFDLPKQDLRPPQTGLRPPQTR